jgi:hypothetical protein
MNVHNCCTCSVFQYLLVNINLLFNFILCSLWSLESSVGIVTSCRLHYRELRFDSRQGQEIFLFSTTSRLALRHTQPPVQLELGAPSPRVKQLQCRAVHRPPYTVKNWGCISLYLHSPIYWHGTVLTDIFTLTYFVIYNHWLCQPSSTYQMHGTLLNFFFLGIPFSCNSKCQWFTVNNKWVTSRRFKFSLIESYFKLSVII